MRACRHLLGFAVMFDVSTTKLGGCRQLVEGDTLSPKQYSKCEQPLDSVHMVVRYNIQCLQCFSSPHCAGGGVRSPVRRYRPPWEAVSPTVYQVLCNIYAYVQNPRLLFFSFLVLSTVSFVLGSFSRNIPGDGSGAAVSERC